MRGRDERYYGLLPNSRHSSIFVNRQLTLYCDRTLAAFLIAYPEFIYIAHTYNTVQTTAFPTLCVDISWQDLINVHSPSVYWNRLPIVGLSPKGATLNII